jgi:hypothetical protein
VADLSLQSFVLARLADFCDWRVRRTDESEHPLPYLQAKLREIEPSLYTLKQQLYEDAVASTLEQVRSGIMTSKGLEDFCFLLERYLAPGDFVDAAFDLSLDRLRTGEDIERMRETLKHLCVHRLLDEERQPPEYRRPTWEHMVREFYLRMDFERLQIIAARRPLSAQRLQYILRRMQRNVAEHCSVFRHPTEHGGTFTPFMTPRMEALLAACGRFLEQLRSLPE